MSNKFVEFLTHDGEAGYTNPVLINIDSIAMVKPDEGRVWRGETSSEPVPGSAVTVAGGLTYWVAIPYATLKDFLLTAQNGVARLPQ